MQNLEKLLGQLFIVGYPKATPSQAFLNFVTEENIGGLILFADNCLSAEKLKDTISHIKNIAGYKHPLIAIDQEGGRVSRIKGVPAEIAAPAEYAKHIGLEQFIEDYTRSMYYLESLGINLNFAPVCDLFINDQNSCLKDRCFGETPEEVIPFIEAAIHIGKKCKVLSCLKHFPGLGDCSIDPHKQTAIGDYDTLVWQQREYEVFKAGIESGVDMIMSTHIKIPKIDDKIATGSEMLINRYLREKLSYDGVVITDELNMNGADELGDIGERTIAAFNAGHDLLLFGQDIDAAMEAYESFRGAFDRGELSKERLRQSLERIAGL